MRLAACFVLAALVGVVPAPSRAIEALTVPSLDRDAGGAPVALRAYLWKSGRPGASPAAVLLHGCGGMHTRSGQVSTRYHDMAKLLAEEGYAALAVDSMGARGVREVCTQTIGERAVSVRRRRLDALGAVAWLASRSDVDPARIVLIGWSHGGSTTLATAGFAPPANVPAKLAGAIAFYPGCRGYVQRREPFAPRAPLVILIGEADDWTPAEPCKALAAELRARPAAVAGPFARQFELHLFPGAHHGFDSDAPLRVRTGIPSVAAGQVTVGGDPASRDAALGILRERLRSWRR